MFWDKVIPLIEKNRIPHTRLSREIGKGESQVGRWIERGTIPPADYAVKIARYFGTTVEALVDDPSEETFAEEIAATYASSKIQMLIDKAKRLPSDKIDVLLQVADGFLAQESSANHDQNVG